MRREEKQVRKDEDMREEKKIMQFSDVKKIGKISRRKA